MRSIKNINGILFSSFNLEYNFDIVEPSHELIYIFLYSLYQFYFEIFFFSKFLQNRYGNVFYVNMMDTHETKFHIPGFGWRRGKGIINSTDKQPQVELQFFPKVDVIQVRERGNNTRDGWGIHWSILVIYNFSEFFDRYMQRS